jgi:hypothetical protein
MNNLEIIEKKNVLAKEDSANFSAMTPEESRAVYLKKMNATDAASQQLGTMQLTDDEGHVLAGSAVKEKQAAAIVQQKEEQAIIQKKEEQAVIDAKLAAAKAHDKEDGVLDFGVQHEDAFDDKVTQKKAAYVAQQEREEHWYDRAWQSLAKTFNY